MVAADIRLVIRVAIFAADVGIFANGYLCASANTPSVGVGGFPFPVDFGAEPKIGLSSFHIDAAAALKRKQHAATDIEVPPDADPAFLGVSLFDPRVRNFNVDAESGPPGCSEIDTSADTVDHAVVVNAVVHAQVLQVDFKAIISNKELHVSADP